MKIRSVFSQAMLAVVFSGMLPSIPVFAASEVSVTQLFDAPIDAFSVRLPDDRSTFQYQQMVDGEWSSKMAYDNDGDVLPGEESELLMLPVGTVGLRIFGITDTRAVHPISVSKEPVKIRTAALGYTGLPSVFSRADWGADASYLYAGTIQDDSPTPDADKSDNGAASVPVQQRANDCLEAQKNYPVEFKVASTVTHDAQGRPYLWPLQYSSQVKLLTVHHAALVVQGDPRPAVERVRALYKYHAVSKQWGDIGYHYIVDEDGRVYEGKQGGAKVVGGHAYCNNVGTIGIVLMGNFEIEQPSQAQARALQRLLRDLAKQYDIDLSAPAQFHGKKYASPIVRHRDLLSTLCPGYYLSEAFGQIINNARTGLVDALVNFPKTGTPLPEEETSTPASVAAEGVTFTGRSSITINPGGMQRLSFAYTAGKSGAYQGKRVAEVRIPDARVKLLLDDGGIRVPITKGVLLPTDLPAYETIALQMIVQAPMDPGVYGMDVAGIHFTISVSGRRARTGDYYNPFTGNQSLIVEPVSVRKSTALSPRIRAQSRRTLRTTSLPAVTSTVIPSAPGTNAVRAQTSQTIRVRLSASQNPTILFSDNGQVDGTSVRGGMSFNLFVRNGECVAERNGDRFASSSILRFQSMTSNILSVQGVGASTRSYKGVLECRMVDGVLVVINELSLDDYLEGLSEEPDTEPYEKQRAFAIAARTYAAYYMLPANRKYPGKPYDGSDDPASFQSYHGIHFSGANPRWLKAAQSTAGQILSFDGQIIKPPYFSSDSGRTKSPEEAGWKNFPFASIFSPKPDPWCSGFAERGHGVGMSGCGAEGQANEGKSAEQILQYYYPGTRITQL